MKLEHSLTPYTKINSKWIKDLNVRADAIKLLEENIGRTLFDIKGSNIFLDPPPIIMKIKTKINKWDLFKLTSFCTAVEITNKMNIQHTKWEKTICKWYDQQAINFQNIHTLVGKRSKQTFLQRRHTDDQNHIKRCSTSLIIKEMQIKTTVTYHHTCQNSHHEKHYR